MSPYFRFGPLSGVSYNQAHNSSNISICPLGIQWIWDILGDCVSSKQEQASAYLGLISLAVWMIVSIPQIIKNFRNLDGLAGVSCLLLLQWVGGDLTNVVGAILTGQLKLQIYLACYFVLSDIILLIQYSMFLQRQRRRKEKQLKEAAADPTPQLILCLMGIFVISHGLCSKVSSHLSLEASGREIRHQELNGHLSRTLLSVSTSNNGSFVHDLAEINAYGSNTSSSLSDNFLKDTGSLFWHDKVSIIGYVLGILSSVFYLGSRLAQIYKNRTAQSTQGLAALTFMLAVIGNLTYGAQIFVRDVSSEFLLQKTPWLVGSLGVVALDCVLLFQFRYYKLKHRDVSEMSRALLNKEYSINSHAGDTTVYIY